MQRVETLDSRLHSMCKMREVIRLAAMSTVEELMTPGGVCGFLADRAHLMDLDVAQIAEVGDRDFASLYRNGGQVTPDSGQWLLVWADLRHKKEISETTPVIIGCARLDNSAGIAGCHSAFAIPLA